jgi:DNA-binding MarR family transcriptional regulator
VSTRAVHPDRRPRTEPAVGRPALDTDLGWALGMVFRQYLKAAGGAMADLPGGPRGYQVLAEAARNQAGTQLALAHRLGIDRTVMTYLLDDLERAGLVERRADPADRRARRIVATPAGRARLTELDRRLRQAEEYVLGVLDEQGRGTFRELLRQVATHAQGLDPVHDPCQVVEEVADAQGLPADGAC